MALLTSEGFGWTTVFADLQTYGAWSADTSQRDGTPTGTIGTAGPSGDNYLTLTTGTGLNALVRYTPIPISTFFFGCRVNPHTLANQPFIFFDSAGGRQLGFVITPSGAIQAILGPGSTGYWYDGGTVLGTSTAGAVAAGSWTYLEIGGTIATGTGGSLTIRSAGTSVLSLTGITTQQTANANVQGFGLAASTYGSPSSADSVSLAHVSVCDNTTALNNTFLGDTRVYTKMMTANSTVQFTPNGNVNNYQNAAQVPPNPTTDYNSDSTVGNQDTFTGAALPAGYNYVAGVVLKTVSKEDTAGTRALKSVVVSGATTAYGTSRGLGTSATQTMDVFQADPNTNALWTVAAVNASQTGYNVSA
jgi:hypothetical protein